MPRLPPVLLTDCTWQGTLAAVRDLGSRGVPVTLACDAAAAPARWSRYVERIVRCPPAPSGARFAEWLRDFTRRNPGHAYVPTSDDAAWIASAHREALAPDLLLDVPPVAALAAVLDKQQLARRAREVGLRTPESWGPADEAALTRLAPALRYPVVVKPRMHVLSSGPTKSAWARSPEELLRAWRAVRDSNRTQAVVRDVVPEAEVPVVQSALDAAEQIYTVDGFIDASGELFVAMACVKLLQCPRGSGPGILFDHAPLDEDLVRRLRSLLHGAGFHGVFDAEFLVAGDRKLLIDVNPRLYNHVAFEVDRGVPIPWMAYLAAIGDAEGLRREVAAASAADGAGRVYAYRARLRLMMLVQGLVGTMGAAERRQWKAWLGDHAGAITDPVVARGDRMPAVGEVLLQLRSVAAHPRAYLRTLSGLRPSAAAPATGTAPDAEHGQASSPTR